MTAITKRLLFWLPRGLCILFALFISMFALDVFDEHATFPDMALALLMHLIPTFIIVAALIVSWRWEWIGALIFSCLAVFYIIAFWGRFDLTAYLCISGPLFLLGLLFLWNWFHHAELRSR
ncbi:MAG TPA: hypothetical protein VGL38_10840 [bacterium]|jgi:hypothetical protein